jgi:phospholipid/cholesterol/gamma-HCH transport system substrate-binding protein
MEPEARYTLVGTVVLVLVATIAVAIYWLRSTTGEGNDVSYKIYFQRQSLEGLQIRSDVKMQGIRIGAVTDFRISTKRPGSVEVVIRVQDSAPIRQDTRASVDRHLLTGIASIRLTTGSESSPKVEAIQPGEPYPLIAEGEPDYRFSESVTQVAERADETMKRISATLSDENQKALTESLANLSRVTARLDRSLGGLDKTLVAMERAANEVSSASSSVSGDVSRLAARYDKLGEQSTLAVSEISTTVRKIGADVERLALRMDGLLADSSVELRLTAQELRATSDSLGSAARRFSDPGRIIFGPRRESLGPGEPAQ